MLVLCTCCCYLKYGTSIISAISSSSEKYRIRNGSVSWNDADAFPNVLMECISGYQYTINGTVTSTISIFTLNSSFTDTQICSITTLTVSPIVRAGNSVLNNVVVTGDTCDRGNYKFLW